MIDYQVFRHNTLFSDLSDHELETLMKISTPLEITPDYCLLREGEIAEDLYFILSGKIAITKIDPQSQHEHLITYLESGDTIGEMALLDHKPRSASAKAKTSAKLLSIPFKELKNLAEKHASFNKIILRIAENVSGRIRKNQ